MSSHSFKINGLDHVAIRVKDIGLSANWYMEHLGLKIYSPEKWQPYPVFLLSDKTGIALFPRRENDLEMHELDHFAFNVSKEAFDKARSYFDSKLISYHFQDHFYFHSIYLKDPDNYTVELTTLVVDGKDFY